MSLTKVSPGQPLRIPADAYNAFVDAAVAYQAGRLAQGGSGTDVALTGGTILVRNDSGAARKRFDVLGLGPPLVLPAANLATYHAQVALSGIAPDATQPGRFAVLQEPIAPGRLGRAVVSGVTPVLLQVVAATDTTAEVTTGAMGALTTGPGGSALILWKESGTGLVHGVVRLLGPSAASTATGDRIQITITQPNHGFLVGHVLYADPTLGKYALADASVPEKSRVVGVVSAVADINTCTLVLAGRISGFTPGALYALAPGTTYYLRPGYPGLVTADPGLQAVPVFTTTSLATEILVGDQPTLYRGSVNRRVYQLNHGFTVGTVIAGNASGTAFSKAMANPGSSFWAAPVGVVSTVIDAHHFEFVSHGIVVVNGLLDYAQYYLSDTTSGLLTATPPAAAIPIGFCMGQGTLFVNIVPAVRNLLVGDSSHNGVFRVRGSGPAGDAVVIDASLVTAANRKLYLREVDVCLNGVAKKMLILASDPY